jgi:UDP-perosamine 4-acetyltransferase
MSLPVIIMGAGGHAKVLIEALLQSGKVIAGIVDSDFALVDTKVLGVPVLGGDNMVNGFSPSEVKLVNGLGSVGLPFKRQQLFERFKSMGYDFATVVHPSAVVASDVELGEGAQVMAGVVIQPGSRIGKNVIINTRASIDHDSRIGDNSHIAPGVTLSGNVLVGESSHIGTGATVIQGINTGTGSFVAAGAVVVRDVAAHSAVYGIPAREAAN